MDISEIISAPRSGKHLRIDALGKIFKDTTNSYKILFFKALLQEVQSGNLSHEIGFQQLGIQMLCNAWYPLKLFKLSLGTQDKLSDIIQEINSTSNMSLLSSTLKMRELEIELKKRVTASQLEKLLRYVVYRVQTPFFREYMRGVPDQNRNKLIDNLAKAAFDSGSPPIYLIDLDRKCIKIHPEWYAFIGENIVILSAWAEYHWIHYLQGRNPSIPAIPHKTMLPSKRASLANQRKLWTNYLNENTYTCAYRNEQIAPDDFTLDHIIPWSFVCHDELWNLIPASRSVNSSKGTTLPSDSQLKMITNVQFDFLQFLHGRCTYSLWNRILHSYKTELKLPTQKIMNASDFESSYFRVMSTTRELARQNGF